MGNELIQFYARIPLTYELIRVLNTDVTIDKLKADIEEISYPRNAKLCYINQ